MSHLELVNCEFMNMSGYSLHSEHLLSSLKLRNIRLINFAFSWIVAAALRAELHEMVLDNTELINPTITFIHLAKITVPRTHLLVNNSMFI